jgi:N-acyl-D-aspartate/D-glutamate deacylase
MPRPANDVRHHPECSVDVPGCSDLTGNVRVRHGRIAAINGESSEVPVGCEYVDATGDLLTPGLIDLHTHGIHQYSYERDPKRLASRRGIARSLWHNHRVSHPLRGIAVRFA